MSSVPFFAVDLFPGRVIPVTSKLVHHWLPSWASGVLASALGLVGPVSVYCDWVGYEVGSAISVSVWQHGHLSEQIRRCDTLACCWDVKQPTDSSNVTGNYFNLAQQRRCYGRRSKCYDRRSKCYYCSSKCYYCKSKCQDCRSKCQDCRSKCQDRRSKCHHCRSKCYGCR